MTTEEKLDETDIRILKLLQQNSRLTVKELAARVHLSPSPTFERQKRLEREGYIQRYGAIVDHHKLGHNVIVLCNIRLKQHTHDLIQQFMDTVQTIDQITEHRDFSFYRNPSADMLLEESEVKKEWFKECHSLHFCSVDLIECPMKDAHKKAIEFALENKSIISFDPNVKLPLWDSEESCRDAILEFLHLAHIVKISDEELEFI